LPIGIRLSAMDSFDKADISSATGFIGLIVAAACLD
jgi:hypothetical protein